MKKTYFLGLLMVTMVIVACKKDDGGPSSISVPLLDRADEAERAEEDIVEFLETHFYNYEEFAAPPADFDFRIRIDTLDGDNADKIPLIDQVSTKEVPDRIEDDLMYNLYFLNIIQGEGDPVLHPDQVTVSYAGFDIADNGVFDSSISPVDFDLTQVVNGFQDGLVEFKASTGFKINPDGTIAFQEFGVGAVFIPSGLGYFEPSQETSITLL